MDRTLLVGLVGALLAVAAASFGPLPLLLPGCALVILAVTAGGWALLAGQGRLERRLAMERVVEDEPCPLTLEAHLLLPTAPGSELVEPLVPGAVQLLEWGRRHRLELEASFSRRGRHRLEPARLVVRDPLGIASRTIGSSPGQEVLVLPRIERLIPARAGGAHAAVLARASDQDSEEGPRIDFDTLREARPEAPAGRIHWPAVARTGTLVERSFLAQADRRPLVVLDAASPSSRDALDSAVRAAASLCVSLAREGGCDLLLPGERRPAHVDPALGSWPKLHTRLALIEEGERVFVPTRLGRVGAIFWVTAHAVADEQATLPRGGSSKRFLVLPGPPTRNSLFTVAGCHGQRLDHTSRRAA